MSTYSIIRFFQGSEPSRTIKDGLTLEEAQEHCEDPETSSTTASDSSLEDECGPWFDGFSKE